MWGDAGLKRDENRGLDEWRVAMRPGRRRQLERGSSGGGEATIRANGASVPDASAKVRYRGLAKNTTAGVALGDLITAERTWWTRVPNEEAGHYTPRPEVTWGLTGFAVNTGRTPCQAPMSPQLPRVTGTTLFRGSLVPARLHQPCRGTSQYRCDFRVFPVPMGRRSRDLCEMESPKSPRSL